MFEVLRFFSDFSKYLISMATLPIGNLLTTSYCRPSTLRALNVKIFRFSVFVGLLIMVMGLIVNFRFIEV